MVRKSQGLIYRIYLNHQPRVMVAFILRQTRRQETKNQVIETRPGQNRRYFTGGPEISGPSLGHGIIIFSPETSDNCWGKVTTKLEFLIFCSSQKNTKYIYNYLLPQSHDWDVGKRETQNRVGAQFVFFNLGNH